jgi:S1-C subfamily serine protease
MTRFIRAAFLCTAVLFPMVGILAAPTEAQDREAIGQALQSVTRLESSVPPDARTASFLGTQRAGTGIVIDDSGLVLTIGYLILEAMAVTVTDADGHPVPARIVAYDYDTGLGLVRASEPLGRPSVRLGDSGDVTPGDTVLIVAEPGREAAQPSEIVAIRQFAGYWEYLLDDALFASPPHPSWQGAAMIGINGELLGIGSLFADDAARRPKRLAGNMFIPVDALKPILGDLLTQGRSAQSDRPWLGIFTSDHRGFVVVTFVAPDGPAANSGVRPGDIVLEVDGERVRSMADFFRAVWKQGKPGVDVPLTLGRQNRIAEITVPSQDRYEYMRLDSSF